MVEAPLDEPFARWHDRYAQLHTDLERGRSFILSTKRLTVSLPLEVYEQAAELASREHRSLSELVREAIRGYAAGSRPHDRAPGAAAGQLVEEPAAVYGLDSSLDTQGGDTVDLNALALGRETFEELQRRAADRGASLADEARLVLQSSVAAPPQLGTLAIECFGPEHGIDLQLPSREIDPPLDFDA